MDTIANTILILIVISLVAFGVYRFYKFYYPSKDSVNENFDTENIPKAFQEQLGIKTEIKEKKIIEAFEPVVSLGAENKQVKEQLQILNNIDTVTKYITEEEEGRVELKDVRDPYTRPKSKSVSDKLSIFNNNDEREKNELYLGAIYSPTIGTAMYAKENNNKTTSVYEF